MNTLTVATDEYTPQDIANIIFQKENRATAEVKIPAPEPTAISKIRGFLQKLFTEKVTREPRCLLDAENELRAIGMAKDTIESLIESIKEIVREEYKFSITKACYQVTNNNTLTLELIQSMHGIEVADIKPNIIWE